MKDVQEVSNNLPPSPPPSDTEVSDDEAEYFYPSDRRGLLSMPSPVRSSGRRLSFPLQKSELEEDEGQAVVDYASGEPKGGRNPLHQDQNLDQDAIFHNISTPSNDTRKVPRSNSFGSPPSREQRRRIRQPKAADSQHNGGEKWIMSPSNSSRKPKSEAALEPTPVLEDQLQKPPMRRKSTVGEDGTENKPPARRRSTVGENGASNGPPTRRRSTAGGNGPPVRRRSTVGEDGANVSIPRINIRRAKTTGEQGSAHPPPRCKSTMDATFSWQPRPPRIGRRRSSMPKNSKPNADATELFYVDPFATTNKAKQVEQGKKIEEERITRRNSLPKASDFHPEQNLATPTATKIKHSRSQDFNIPFAGDDDDPYDEEGNLIRRKAPRRRSVTNTPQRFHGVDATTPDFQTARKLQVAKNTKDAMQIDPLATTTSDFQTVLYVDPFATTNKAKQVEQGKKIEKERTTRRNSLPKASYFPPEQQLLTPTPTKMRQSKSQEFNIPFAGGDDDPYDEEGNLIRRKAPRRRSVTNTPQRFHGVDATTPDFQTARKLQVATNMKEAMQIDPFAATPDFQKANKLHVNKNLEKAMQIDPFEDTEEVLASSDLASKPFPDSRPRNVNNNADSSDDDDKLRSSLKKGKKKKKGSQTLSGHLRNDEGKGQKDGKEVASMGSKNSVDTRSTAGSTDPSGHSDIHTSDFKLTKPRIEQLKGGDENYEGFRLGRRLSNSSAASKDPRRRSKNGKKAGGGATPETPTQKKSFLQRRLSQSPRRGSKKKSNFFSSLNASNHSRNSSDDDDNLISVSPKRKSSGSKSRERRAGGRRTTGGEKLKTKLDDGSGKRKHQPPTRCKSDAGPRAIRISMTGNIDLLSNANSREPGIRSKRRSMSADGVKLFNDSDADSDADSDNAPPVHEDNSNSLNATPLSRVRKNNAEQQESRHSGSSRRRRSAVGSTTEGTLMKETEQAHLPDGAVESRLSAKAQARTSKSPSPRKPRSNKNLRRRNSLF